MLNRRTLFVSVLGLSIVATVSAQPTLQRHKLPGNLVDVDGNTAVISTTMDTLSGSPPFPTEVTLYNTDSGTKLFDLIPDEDQAGNIYGSAVAVSGQYAIVSSADDTSVPGLDENSVYVFDVATGEQLHRLVPDGPNTSDLRFGWSIATNGVLAAVGAPQINAGVNNAVYVFDLATGAQLHEIRAHVGVRDLFGASVAMDDQFLLIGAPTDNTTANDAGAFYIYDAATAQQLHFVPADFPRNNLHFGENIAIENGNILVGVPRDNREGSRGAAHWYDAQTGTQVAQFHASLFPGVGPLFGRSVDLAGTLALVGADGSTGDPFFTGTAFLFDITTGLSQNTELISFDAEFQDNFGSRVALTEGTALIAALGDDEFGVQTGSIYVFSETCVGDCDSSGVVDFNDLVAMLFEFGDESFNCDTDGSGDVSFNDLVATLFLFGPCP